MKNLSHFGNLCLSSAMLLVLCAGNTAAKGSKYGVFVGINDYPKPIPQLNGCVNDATNLQRTMIDKFGFSATDTTLLKDGEATREKIIAAINAYQKKASMGDLFVLTYSGHGTLFPDKYSQQIDETKPIFMKQGGEIIFPLGTYDSAIVPIDSDARTSGKPWGNLILDDEIYALFSEFTRKGANVIFISDSCHSGSISRAPARYRVRMVPLATVFKARSFDQLTLQKPKRQWKSRISQKTFTGRYLAMTGSRDDEFSLDWETSDRVPTGLFTYVLLNTINDRTTPLGYKDLMAIVSSRVAELSAAADNNQHPQLDLRFFRGSANTRIFSVP